MDRSDRQLEGVREGRRATGEGAVWADRQAMYVSFVCNLILQTLTFVAGVCAHEQVALDVTPIPN